MCLLVLSGFVLSFVSYADYLRISLVIDYRLLPNEVMAKNLLKNIYAELVLLGIDGAVAVWWGEEDPFLRSQVYPFVQKYNFAMGSWELAWWTKWKSRKDLKSRLSKKVNIYNRDIIHSHLSRCNNSRSSHDHDHHHHHWYAE